MELLVTKPVTVASPATPGRRRRHHEAEALQRRPLAAAAAHRRSSLQNEIAGGVLVALVLLAMMCASALMSVETAGIRHVAGLFSGPEELVRQTWRLSPQWCCS
jgi:hypothetical protein